MAPRELEASPGEEFIKMPMPMRVPALDFILRLSCDMAPTKQPVGAAFDTSLNRTIMPIVGGLVKGPGITATIEPSSGADWGMAVKGSEVCLVLQPPR